METEWLETLLKREKKIGESGINCILSVEQEPAVAKGENFASVILRYKVVVALTNGEKTTRYLILKTIPECCNGAAYCTETSIFRNEIFIYASVLKEMEVVMKEFNDKRGKLWCTLIGYRNYDRVVLEDLCNENFTVMNRREMLDLEHSLLAARSLARYHALSAVLLKRSIVTPTDLGPFVMVSNERMIDMFFVSFFSTLAETVKNNWGPEWSQLAKHLHRASQTAQSRYKEMVKFNETRFNVINHGDCWTNNMMFSHIPGTKKPSGIRFIDYQLSHCNSFAWDLTYFLYNSIRPNIRRAKYMDLLTAYQQSLQEYLTMYMYPIDEIPNLQNVVDEMERLKFFGFGVLVSIHAFTSAETGDSYDLFLAYGNKLNPAIGINKDIFTCKFFRNKVEKDMLHFMKDGVI